MGAGSMSSASRTRPMRLTLMKHATSSRPEQLSVSACAYTATNSVLVQVFSWPSSWPQPVLITAPIWTMRTSMRWLMQRIRRWQRCFRESSSVLARRIRMPLGCSRQESRSHWPLTAIQAPATRAQCRG